MTSAPTPHRPVDESAGGAPAPRSGRPPAPRNAGEMLTMAKAFLGRKGLEESRLEAELLVAAALGTDRMGLFLRLDQPVNGSEVDRARDLLVRRGRREPVAYITGTREFYGRRFAVGPGVLIPRPESELLVDLARERAEGRSGLRVLDVGTGSGCLAVTLALELERAEVVAVDSSPAAVERARENADTLGAAVEVVLGDGFAAARARGPFDLVVANPPYVDPADRDSLAEDVREHEPAEALFAPEGDPDLWVRELVRARGEWLAPGGVLLVELGCDQGQRALALTAGAGRLHADLAGIDRVLEAAP